MPCSLLSMIFHLHKLKALMISAGHASLSDHRCDADWLIWYINNVFIMLLHEELVICKHFAIA